MTRISLFRHGGMRRGRVFAAAAFLCLGVFAQDATETISIWKMERDPYSGKCDVRSLQKQAYDFTTVGTFGAADVPFTGTPAVLPDNPGWLDDPVNRSALQVSSGMLKNAAIIPYLELTNSWTVEGWYCLREFPNDGDGVWKYVFGTRNSADGWFVTSRNRSGVYQFELYSKGNPGTAIADGTVVWGYNPDDVTNTWKHLALSYDANGTETPGKGVWKFYVDGEITVALTNATAATGRINTSNFYIGGRDTDSRRSYFSADYWRVTRGVLTPEQFLNASGVKPGTVPGTLAFYRLDQDGGFENAVGSAYRLSADYPYGTSYSQAYNYVSNFKIAPSARQAFDTLPNPSIPLENSGSVRLLGLNGRLEVEGNLGMQLEPDKPFTIEGWVYRQPVPYSARSWTMMFGTRQWGAGFSLWYGMNDDRRNAFGMYCNTTGGVMRADAVFPNATNVPFENEWKHIALTQTPNGFEDKTVWELFLDGESMGCVTGMIASANMTGRSAFYIGSRPADSLGAGCYDCFRVCSRVLAPSEFLNATNGTAVASADILAFWPLDSINNGLYLDLHDRTGNYPIGKFSDFTGRVALSSEQAAASVPNPDSAVRIGDPKKNNGSVSFPDVSKPNYLYVGDDIGKSFLSLTNDFTIESWICHKKLPSGWSIVYGAGYNAPRWGLWIRKNNDVVKYMMIAQKSGGVYLVNDNTFFSKDGAYATITDADLNVWRHVALVYRADVGNGTFELFLDGVSKGTIELLSAPPAGGTGIAGDLFVGGRPSDTGHSLIGNIDLLRISSVALTPDQFLCAAAQGTPVAPKTLAYWPLDYDGAAVDLSDRVSGAFPFVTTGTAPVGTNVQFRARVGNPDKTPGFIGDPSANVGSILNTSGCAITMTGLRSSVSVFSSFTAEGWICWSGNGALPQAITGNQLESARGWTLSLQDANTLRLEVREAHGWLLVDKVFDTGADSLNGCWRHVAVAYSLASGNRGRWEVFLDGRSLGTADNAVTPEAVDGFKGRYGIGAQTAYTPFDGMLDCWRVSDGVLDPADFLYTSPKGMTILFR